MDFAQIFETWKAMMAAVVLDVDLTARRIRVDWEMDW